MDSIAKTPLEQFPTLNKELLMTHFDELVTDRSLKQKDILRFCEDQADGSQTYLRKYHIVHSSGSTGTPRYFVYDNAAWEQVLLGVIRGALWDLSMTEILKLLAEKPRILYIAATGGRYGGAMAVSDGVGGVRAEQRFLDISTPLAKWIDTLQKFKPSILIGYPSTIKILAELMESEGVKSQMKRIISCGEPLNPELRQYLEATFDTVAFEYSTVDADIVGKIDSVLNPSGGVIKADKIDELIIEKDKVDSDTTKIICRQERSKTSCVCA